MSCRTDRSHWPFWRTFVAALLTISPLLSAPAGAASASSPSPKGFVLFAWWHHGNEELSVVSPSGKVHLLASGNISGASWSPDGSRVVLARYDGRPPSAPSSLSELKSFTGSRIPAFTTTTPGVRDLLPVWSPDRATIAFTRHVGTAPSRIYLVDNDGTHARPATTETATRGDWWPQWSRSGKYLAFLRDDEQGTDLVVANPATGSQQVVTSSGAIHNGFSWEPNDTLVYVDGDDAHSDLFGVRADGSHLRQLTHDQTAKYTPVASPDGRHVAFAQRDAPSLHLYLLDTVTDTSVRLTDQTGRQIGPTWSPDSRFLAYTAGPVKRAKLIPEETRTSIVRIDIHDPKRSMHVLVVGKNDVIPIAWQPSPTGYPPTDGLPYPRK